MKSLVALAACLAIVACSSPAVPTRQLVFLVDNQDVAPQRLLIARAVDKVEVGSMQPAVIPPGARIQVTLTVPVHEGWALYLVEPGQPAAAPIMYGGEFGACSGEVPLEIQIDVGGSWGSSLNGSMC